MYQSSTSETQFINLSIFLINSRQFQIFLNRKLTSLSFVNYLSSHGLTKRVW